MDHHLYVDLVFFPVEWIEYLDIYFSRINIHPCAYVVIYLAVRVVLFMGEYGSKLLICSSTFHPDNEINRVDGWSEILVIFEIAYS